MAVFWHILTGIGWVLLGVLGLLLVGLALVLFLPLEIRAAYDGSFRYRIRFGGIPVGSGVKKLLMRFMKSPEPELPHKRAEEQPPKSRLQRLQDMLPKLHTVRQGLQIAETYLPAVQEAVPKLCRAIRIRRLHVHCTLAGTDAAQTAIQYGELSAGLAVLTPMLYDVFTVGDLYIRLTPDFCETKTGIRLDGRISTCLAALLAACTVFLKTYLNAEVRRPAAKKNAKTAKGRQSA